MQTRQQKIDHARQYAHEAHDYMGQKRKFTNEPYWTHTDAVAGLLSVYTDDVDIIVAGHLHDVIEDVIPTLDGRYTDDVISAIFGSKVYNLIREVTNVFTKDAFPYLGRNLRKQCEAARLGKISPEAQTIKYADIIHNIASGIGVPLFEARDFTFSIDYAGEKLDVLRQMTAGNIDLYKRAYNLCRHANNSDNYIANHRIVENRKKFCTTLNPLE